VFSAWPNYWRLDHWACIEDVRELMKINLAAVFAKSLSVLIYSGFGLCVLSFCGSLVGVPGTLA
jgi:hypothetical protein